MPNIPEIRQSWSKPYHTFKKMGHFKTFVTAQSFMQIAINRWQLISWWLLLHETLSCNKCFEMTHFLMYGIWDNKKIMHRGRTAAGSHAFSPGRAHFVVFQPSSHVYSVSTGTLGAHTYLPTKEPKITLKIYIGSREYLSRLNLWPLGLAWLVVEGNLSVFSFCITLSCCTVTVTN